jgi:hypothetical protein
MSKKSLSDLLKEEASKADTLGEAPAPANPSDETTPAPEGETARLPIQSHRKTASSRAKTPKGTSTKGTGRSTAQRETTAQPRNQISPPPPSDKTADAALSVTPSNGPTGAELAATLAVVQREKADLEKIVQGLQEDLAAQQSRLFELTDSLDQAQAALKTKTASLQEMEEALTEAKATILKLSAPAPAPAATAPSRPALPRRSGGDIIPRQSSPGPAQPGYVRGVPTYTPQSDQPNPMLSDADIGWVD